MRIGITNSFDFMFTIVPIFIGIMFIVTIFMIIAMFIPSLRAKFYGLHLKSAKRIIDENEDILKDIHNKNADIQGESITKKTSAVAKGFKRGLTEDNMYCKYCGALITSDSNYCNKCGKKVK